MKAGDESGHANLDISSNFKDIKHGIASVSGPVTRMAVQVNQSWATAMRILVPVLLVVFLYGCTRHEQIQQLDGVMSVSPTASGVEVRPSPALQVGVPPGGVISLTDGEESSFGDGHHVTIRLTYMGPENYRYRFRHETLHIPPGGKIETKVAYFAVPAY